MRFAITPVLFLALAATSLFAQTPAEVAIVDKQAGLVTLRAGESGITLPEFLKAWTRATQRRFNYSEVNFRDRPKIQLTDDVTVPLEKADQLFRGLLVSQGFALVPTGPDEANLWTVESLESSRSLKSQVIFVPESDLPLYQHRAGQLILTTIALRYTSVTQVRGAVQQILVNRNFEFAQEVPSANAVVLTGFAPTIHALSQVLRAMDLPAPTAEVRHFPLKHASAEEIVPVISFLAARRAGPTQPQEPSAAPQLSVIADPRTNGILVHGTPAEIPQIERLIKVLDVPAPSDK